MSTYNEKVEWIQASISSILNQTFKNIELIIIVDNPLNQEIRQCLEQYSGNKRVSVFFNEKNMGLVYSLNRAISVCHGEYIARMDADDIAIETRLQKELDYLNDNNLDFVFANVNQMSENGKVTYRNAGIDMRPSEINKIIRYGNVSKHPTWFLKSTVFSDLGGYRNIEYCEDFDFVLRALSMDFKIGLLGTSVLNYRYRESSISRSNALEQFLKADYIKRLYIDEKLISTDVTTINEKYNNLSRKSKENYAQGLLYFQCFVKNLKQKNILASGIFLIRTVTTSKFLVKKVVDTTRFKIYERKLSKV